MSTDQNIIIKKAESGTSEFAKFVYLRSSIQPKKIPNTYSGTLSYADIVENIYYPQPNTRSVTLRFDDLNYVNLDFKNYQSNYRFFNNDGIYKSDIFLTTKHLGKLKNTSPESENNDLVMKLIITNLSNLSVSYLFLNSLKSLDNQKNEIEGMKKLYKEINKRTKNNEFDLIDTLIKNFILLKFSFQFHISLLAATLNIRKKIYNREKLFRSAIDIGKKGMELEKVYATLDGLY